MYPYPNYSMNQYRQSMPTYYTTYSSDDRFIPSGFVLPLILGGLGGYAIGSNQNNNQMPVYYCPYPYCYPPMPRR